MAITRAQQVRQMLEDGGMLVSPSKDGKRPGYRRSNYDASGGGTSKSSKEAGSAGPDREDRANLREQASVASTQGLKTPTLDEVKAEVYRGPDDRGNFLQNRNQRNIIEYNKNLKKIEENKNLNFIEKFNAKKKLKNQQFINNKFTQKAQGIANAYGLSVNQLKNLLDAYEEDPENQIGLFSKMQDILDMDPSARKLGQDFNEDIMKGALGAIELSPRMKKGVNLSTAELFDMTDPTSRIELPGILNKLQGDPSFSNVLSGLNRLQALDKISQTPGGVSQSEVDNYFNLTMGKGGINPITGETVDALFNPKDDNDRSMTVTDPCKGPNPPAYCFVNQDPTTPPDPTPDRNLGGLAPRIAGSIFNFDGMADGGRIGAMDGGMMSPEGGIMDLESGRQMYFLGKLVKKATRAVKKIAKSPIGKAAILGGAMYFGGGAGAGKLGKFFGTGSFNPFKTKIPGVGNMSSGLGKILSKIGVTDFVTGDLTLGGKLGLGTLALPFLMGDEEEEQDMNMGPELTMEQLRAIRNSPYRYTAPRFEGSQYKFADGGLMRMGYQEGSKEPVASKTMPLLDMGGKEMDLREDGGFVPIGRMEKADDVPARLSKNEFVFTADAVRNAGEGDVDKGAEVMYNMMKNLESGGEVSEESQGLQGARDMFQTSKRLEEVL